MSTGATDWQQTWRMAQRETNRKRLVELCEQARRLLFHRDIELAAEASESGEREQLVQALRDLWILEHRTTK
ncbi:MAG TPA: hypothetical protein VFI95_24770 [Terriglobales bacterium]|nr:hypothetical protein [Terriglobales bacterium]